MKIKKIVSKTQPIFWISVLLISSCGKSVDEVSSDFIGNWKGEKDDLSYIIRLDENGDGRFGYVGNGTSTNVQGRARINNETLRISMRRFEINQFPYLQDSIFFMEVDGVVYRKFE